ncbi:hypothetical protein [Prevotella sp. P2-180]|uniref:hypothetical protein n=1 Tax=Prevotella sp. P2-180 TaxID=2024224 RepID=UPI000B96A903|nr:hypothetical protein [Prevotella sp. P2-180]OYP64557.1 hypothetical protein CIK98_10350 [Prevotella sp. P2-180]
MSRTVKNADIDGGRSVMLVGVVHVTDQKNVTFCPDDPVPGVVEPFVRTGKGQLMRDGTFDFTPQPSSKRRRGILLKKVAHGRLSATKDGAFLLTLKVFKHEGLDVENVMEKEAKEAIGEGFRTWQK